MKQISENTPIYAITCLTRLEENNGWPDFGATAFMGYYFEKDVAFQAVKENRCDIAEHCYHYAVIERILPGLYSYPKERWLFEYDHDNDRFVPIEEPEVLKHIGGIL